MAEIDLVIRGGTVADGSGNSLYEADVAVSDGKIVEVGRVAGKGREEIDARGKLVTPGFVDVHTHYDAQVDWSTELDPSSSHGVTTTVMGNCGVGFAPCRPEHREHLIHLMEGVEDIPAAVMREGLSWKWESFADYLDAIDSRPHDIDFAALLPHAPLRVYVMGDRAINMERATEQDRAQMRRIARDAMAAGACGFSTSRNLFAQASDGAVVYSMAADDDELREIALGMADAGRGVIQAITMKEGFSIEQYKALHHIARESGRPISYTLADMAVNKGLQAQVEDLVRVDSAAGLDVRMQSFNRPVGMLMSLQTSLHPFVAHPYFIENLAQLDLAGQVERMRDPAVRAKLIEPAGELNHPLASFLTAFDAMYLWGDTPDYEPAPETRLDLVAKGRGQSPYEVLIDAFVEGNGRTFIFVALANYNEGHLDNVLRMMRNDRNVIALGDGGAHYRMICDVSYSTFMLTHWARDRKGERINVEEAVRQLTDLPARLQRFNDRGRIAVGLKADLNVIDFDRLTLPLPTVVKDLPAGGSRLMQRASGYAATIVSGVVIRRDDTDTGARPGRLVRYAGI